MNTRTYGVVSADGHLEIPPDAWMRHVASEYRDQAPRLVNLPAGGEGWLVEGSPMVHNGQNISAGRPLRVKGQSYWNDDGSPVAGTGDAAQRLREQDADGIDAEVLYPPVFISRFIENLSDRDAYLAMVRAYNTFLAEDYCSVAPDRLIGNAVIPTSGLDDALAELRRVHALGLRSIVCAQFPHGAGTPSDADDQFWRTALELGMAITAHGGMGDRNNPLLVSSAHGTFDLKMAILSRTTAIPLNLITSMLLSGVFERIPELRIYLAEVNAGWMPEAFYMMDDSYQLFRDWYGANLDLLPSEYAKKHFYFGIVRDPVALKMGDLVPVDRLMFGTDFPHSVTSYPETEKWLDVIFDGVPDDVRRMVLVETPCAFFGLDPAAALTPTPAQ
jgi:predicted TIM-barrel fold metal-dependent hydrolase